MNPLDRSIAATFFSSFAATAKTEEAYTPRALASRIQAVTASCKGDLPWLKLARFGTLRSDKNSLRHDANVLAVTGIEADYDGGKLDFDTALDLLVKQGIAAILYTSPSHTEDAPRWRALCPFAEEMPPQRRAPMLGRLNGLFGGIFSGESWTLSQSYYYGSVRHNSSHRVELVDGATIDAHDDLDAIWRGKASGAGATTDTSDGTSDGCGDAELIRRVVSGDGLHGELCGLAARYIGRGMALGSVLSVLQGLMLAQPEAARDERWRDRFASIDDLVASAGKKYSASAATHRHLARLAVRLLRAGIPDDDVLKRLDEANASQPVPTDPERIGEIAIWAARIAGGRHAAR